MIQVQLSNLLSVLEFTECSLNQLLRSIRLLLSNNEGDHLARISIQSLTPRNFTQSGLYLKSIKDTRLPDKDLRIQQLFDDNYRRPEYIFIDEKLELPRGS